MKATLNILSLMILTVSLNAFAQERSEAHLDLGLQREVTQVTIEEVETVTGIVPPTSEEIEVADLDVQTDAD